MPSARNLEQYFCRGSNTFENVSWFISLFYQLLRSGLHIYELELQLTPCSRVLLEKLTVRSASQESPRILWKPKDSFPCSQQPVPVPIPGQMNPIHTLYTYLLNIRYNISSRLCLSLKKDLPSGFLTKILYAVIVSPMRATCPDHFILHYLIILIFGE
jgi:hypothetical protein